VAEIEALPLPLVMAVGVESAADAPLPGAEKDTIMLGRGLLDASLTTTVKAVENAAPTAAD
jgi:hypothetical protein